MDLAARALAPVKDIGTPTIGCIHYRTNNFNIREVGPRIIETKVDGTQSTSLFIAIANQDPGLTSLFIRRYPTHPSGFNNVLIVNEDDSFMAVKFSH